MSKRITLLAAAVLAASLVGLVGAGCAEQAQKKQMTAAEAYAAMGTPTMILTVESEGPSAPAVEALVAALADPKRQKIPIPAVLL